MKHSSQLRRFVAIITGTVALLFSAMSNAMTFSITFDDNPDPGVSEPFVGSGVFSFNEELADGSYALDTLSNVVFFAEFINGSVFTLADTEDFLNEVLAVITTDGNNRVLRFGNINGNSGGAIDGAFDFINQAGMNLSFQPGVDGGDFYGSGSDYFGNYTAVSAVPIPAAVWFLGSGLMVLYGYGRRS